MGIYTRTGDEGQTSVIGGRVSKDDDRVEAYGTIDELNSFVGQAISFAEGEKFADIRDQLEEVQQELFDCGSDLAFVKINESKYKVKDELAERLEGWIDACQEENPKVERFIIPGAARCPQRFMFAVRFAAERNVVLSHWGSIPKSILRYVGI